MPRNKRDQLMQAVEQALDLGQFVSYYAATAFMGQLEAVERGLRALVTAEPQRAVGLYEAFIAGCHEKAEEVDDSDGELGLFVRELFCGWIRARQAAGAEAQETVALLLSWADDDPYGFCARLEQDAVKALDAAGHRALERALRQRLGAAAVGDRSGAGHRQTSQQRRAANALRALYVQRGNASAYQELCELTDLGPRDCEVLAEIHRRRRRPEQAVTWVERGIALEQERGCYGGGSAHGLDGLRRKLLVELGRGEEALQSAWELFAEHPCDVWYDELMRYVPRAERSRWQRRALNAAAQGALDELIRLCLKTKQLELLADRVGQASHEELERISHYVSEPAARRLARSHPDLAAKLHRAQAMRIVEAGKSKYYGAAIQNFEQARRLYARAGQQEQWEALVRRVRAEHARKRSLMGDFERLVAGGRTAGPPFAERSRRQWSRRRG